MKIKHFHVMLLFIVSIIIMANFYQEELHYEYFVFKHGQVLNVRGANIYLPKYMIYEKSSESIFIYSTKEEGLSLFIGLHPIGSLTDVKIKSMLDKMIHFLKDKYEDYNINNDDGFISVEFISKDQSEYHGFCQEKSLSWTLRSVAPNTSNLFEMTNQLCGREEKGQSK